jgi:phenylpropionate dioxygenase-like ring-hydroxylating dioxygenase large terminal subunit
MTSTSTRSAASGLVPERWALGPGFVPKGRYVDRDFARLEHERLFSSVWQMACREEDLDGPGAFHDYTIGDQSILVVRQADGSLRAMHNACRHRGMKIIGGSGRVEEFRCRFHGFRYALDGACTFVNCPDEFPDRPDSEWALQPVHVDTWGGWVFVNPAPDPEPLLEWLDPLPTLLAPFRLHDMRYKWRKRVVVPANWKTVVDAFVEGYHTPGTHPQVLRPFEGLEPSARPAPVEEYAHAPFAPTFTFRNHSVSKYSERPETEERNAEWAEIMGRPEVYANMMRYLEGSLKAMQTERDARAAAQLATMELPPGMPAMVQYLELAEKLALDEGVDYPRMSIQEYFEGNGDYHVFPTMVILVEKCSVLGYRMRPDGDDPDSSIWDVFCIEHFAPGEQPTTTWEVFPNWREADLGPFLAQDLKNIPDIQAGMHSDGYEGLWLNSVQETTIMNAHRVADRFLFGVDHGDPS